MDHYYKLNINNLVNLKIFKLLAISIFFSINIPVLALNHQIDSLKGVIDQLPEDTSMVNSLNALSTELANDDPSQSIIYGEKAKALAEKLNFQRGLGYAYKNIGMGYYHLGDYPKVFEYWPESLKTFEAIKDTLGIANIINNLGVIYFNQGDNAQAIGYYLRSLQISEVLKDKYRIATALVNIGSVYAGSINTYDNALQYYWKALPLSEEIGDNDLIGAITDNMGDIYLKRDQLDSAQFYLEKSLIANDNTIYLTYSLNLLGEVFEKKGEYDVAIKYQSEAYEIARNLESKHGMAQSLVGLGVSQRSNGELNTSIKTFTQAESIGKEIGSKNILKDTYHGLALANEKLGKYEEAFHYHTLFSAMKDTIFNTETDDKIKRLQFTYEIDKKQTEVDLLTKDKELQELNIKRQKLAINASITGLVLILIIAITIYRNYRHKVKTNRLLDKQNEEIEKLLLNILPAETAKELQKVGYATPKYYDSASVLFTDFKGFTKIAGALKPHELIAELNSFFNAFDDIIEQHHLEKIKTIGDAYMCAGGIPVANDTHPIRIVKAGLAIQEYMKVKNVQRIKQGMQTWELRVGIHTGPIVAGVVGKKKYAYDIWGDTVNIASRMESNGEVGKVNISAATHDLVKDHFEYKYRGKIEAKNKGFIDMYFLEREKETAFARG